MSGILGPTRPIGVTVVAALVWIGAVMDVVAGILVFALLGAPELAEEYGGTGGLVSLAIASILFGVAAFIVGFGLLAGNPVARLAITVLELFSIGISVWHFAIDPNAVWSELVSILIAIAIVGLLWVGDAGRWFRQLAPDEPDDPKLR
ncbi:hypothetical protein [Agromyces archimandritae]|uniref:Uncharacterized protein n=1 Tax=Agromyces archimandritae TaxID=2781962 RepID=A0A975FPF4_9MICO|nr:hypothetical protein [Agromyces archimandritae]QTX05594.1 hypothetical protein G127AT_05120 [Agromyces archimandritae]